MPFARVATPSRPARGCRLVPPERPLRQNWTNYWSRAPMRSLQRHCSFDNASPLNESLILTSILVISLIYKFFVLILAYNIFFTVFFTTLLFKPGGLILVNVFILKFADLESCVTTFSRTSIQTRTPLVIFFFPTVRLVFSMLNIAYRSPLTKLVVRLKY